nr:MAG TPA: hypothetical protein [Caudoviricetes sp.]
MLMILPTSQLLEIGSMKLPSAIKLSSKPQKIFHWYKKNFRGHFLDPKKFVCARFGIIKNRWGFLPPKISHFSVLKKRLNFYIFFL